MFMGTVNVLEQYVLSDAYEVVHSLSPGAHRAPLTNVPLYIRVYSECGKNTFTKICNATYQRKRNPNV